MSIILAVVILVLALYVLAVLTEYFFVPSIDIISKKLKLSSDAAGATLLAMGSSAPEFFTSLIAVLGLAGGHGDIGTGTIVGSAIFNVLVIVGVAAMFRAVTLQWQPVMRDQLFYIVSIILLLITFWDGKIVLAEAITFVLFYGLYVFLVVNWRKWFKYKDIQIPEPDEPEKEKGLKNLSINIIGVLIPKPNKKPKLYVITFIVSILAIAGLSWVLVSQIVVIADALNINAVFLALTVLAAGTSIPDLIGSAVVAKQGRGDMAVSNAIGSNIFDILFALGLPWMIALTIKPGAIQVGTENLFSSIFLLFATVVAMLFLLIIRKWKIGSKAGILLIVLYVLYCLYIAFDTIL